MTEKQLKFTLVLVSAFAASVLVFMLIRKNRQTQRANAERENEKRENNENMNGFYNNSDSLAAINHNPTNLINDGSSWIGKIDTPERIIKEGRSTRFCAFENDYFGLRAALINLKNGYFSKGLTTISKIISKWAPSSENNTDKYIENVAKMTGIDKDVKLNVDDKGQIFELLRAIAYIDGGFIGDDIIRKVIKDNL